MTSSTGQQALDPLRLGSCFGRDVAIMSGCVLKWPPGGCVMEGLTLLLLPGLFLLPFGLPLGLLGVGEPLDSCGGEEEEEGRLVKLGA